MQSSSFNPISAGTQMSIKALYYDFCEFMVENYSATPDQLTLDWNCVGATARYHGQNRAFELHLWERSEGHLGYGYAMRQKLTGSATSPTRATPPRTQRFRYRDAKSFV